MSKRQLDDVDTRILEHLSRDARVSNREIAEDLSLAEGTVRGRIKRLQADKVIKIMAIADVRVLTQHEHPMMAYIGVHAELASLHQTARKIADLDFVRFAATMLGRYDILAISFVASAEELIEHVNDEILALPGVKHVDTKLAIKSLKYDYRWGRIVE
ncbi:MAG: Lrp/AsnC family transcriptional regulator [Gammaproteobacteria bacterium]|nr:Lrp/AsnC family transcriptional regulator [Gammaproteobacteria bacterium]MDH3371908.1 Lrp/AsnC family transcriptional regulator [Gammaproteobacteria bacterium]MDH3407763.1 Lrp/AsnC family transcriptional regulator [Gammaproteobacteria bacterium]MDH3551118.1 Lrp/AsnC family transcriptional regulator [Gammaproteobacteria bacterium]